MVKPCTCRNPPLTGGDELARDALRAPTKGSGIPTPTIIISYAPTPALAQAPAPIQAPAPAQAPIPGPPGL